MVFEMTDYLFKTKHGRNWVISNIKTCSNAPSEDFNGNMLVVAMIHDHTLLFASGKCDGDVAGGLGTEVQCTKSYIRVFSLKANTAQLLTFLPIKSCLGIKKCFLLISNHCLSQKRWGS